MELGDWARYFALPPAERRKLYNIVSLSLANTPLEVSEIDLVTCAVGKRQHPMMWFEIPRKHRSGCHAHAWYKLCQHAVESGNDKGTKFIQPCKSRQAGSARHGQDG